MRIVISAGLATLMSALIDMWAAWPLYFAGAYVGCWMSDRSYKRGGRL